jgi:hypothetical protein
LGFQISLSGTGYICDAVLLDPLPKHFCEVYDYIAARRGTTPQAIERSMRHAIEVFYTEADVPDWATGKASKGKLENRVFIYRLKLFIGGAENAE